MLRLKSPVKYPALRDSMRLLLPTAELPKTLSFSFEMGELEGMSWSM